MLFEPCKHEDSSLIPHNHDIKVGRAGACLQSLGWGDRHRWIPVACAATLAWSENFTQMTQPVSKISPPANQPIIQTNVDVWRIHPNFSSELHMYIRNSEHVNMKTHIHTHINKHTHTQQKRELGNVACKAHTRKSFVWPNVGPSIMPRRTKW